MAKVDTESTKTTLRAYLDPGEELLHVAYGIRPPGIFAVLVLAILTAGIGVVAMHAMSKHYLVGVTRSRLLLLRVSGFGFTPIECTKLALNKLTQVRTNAGPIFVRLEFTAENGANFIKFHRAAFSGNREGAITIGQALESGRLAPDPGSPQALLAAVPGVGAEVLVRHADGGDYPAQVAAVQGNHCLCRFTNGSENWVDAPFVRVSSTGPAAPPPLAPLVQTSASSAESNPQVHAMLGIAMGVGSVLTSVVLMLQRAVFGDLSFDVLFSESGLFSMGLIFNWAVGAAIAGTLAAVLSAVVSTQNPTTRGVIIGAVTFPGKVLFAGAFFALIDGSGIVDRSIGALVRLVLQPSLMTLLVWAAYMAVGAVAATALHRRAPASQPRATSSTV